MKRHLITISLAATLLVSCMTEIRAQEDIHILKLDFKKKVFEKDFKQKLAEIKTGDFYRIEIDNIDLYHYNVSIVKSDSLISKELPKLGELEKTVFKMLTESTRGSVIPEKVKLETYASLPLQFSKEQATVKITIAPRENTEAYQVYSTQIVFPIIQSEFWGVSSGFYGGWIHSEAYSTKRASTSTDSSYSIINEKPSQFEVGISAMVRRGWSLSEAAYLQIGIGPAVSIADKLKPRMMFGVGLAWGGKQKLVWDIGVVFGYTDKLSNAYTLHDQYKTKPDNLTVSVLQSGVYTSLSYVFIE
jgi:hypothetical protein